MEHQELQPPKPGEMKRELDTFLAQHGARPDQPTTCRLPEVLAALEEMALKHEASKDWGGVALRWSIESTSEPQILGVYFTLIAGPGFYQEDEDKGWIVELLCNIFFLRNEDMPACLPEVDKGSLESTEMDDPNGGYINDLRQFCAIVRSSREFQVLSGLIPIRIHIGQASL